MIIVDAFWGSSGKGKLAASLADSRRPCIFSSSNYPNAGHTVHYGGQKFVLKVFPAGVVPVRDKEVICIITPNSGFHINRLFEEWHMLGKPRTIVHPRAVVMNSGHASYESNHPNLRKLSSTMQGCAAAQTDKIFREPNLLAEHYKNLIETDSEGKIQVTDVNPDWLWANLVLHEVSQGFALSIDWGTHYPHCTSRNCVASQAYTDLGVPPNGQLGQVWLNVRTFPIRVGSLPEGYSGDMGEETTLRNILTEAGCPQELYEQYEAIETTTVTKRKRRHAKIDWQLLKRAADINGAHKLAINFAQYLDWNDYKCRDHRKLSPRTMRFIRKAEQTTGVAVGWVGTGPDHSDVVWMP